MVLRRFHRTAGPVLLLALFGILAAIFIPRAAQNPLRFSMSFESFTNSSGETRALFIVPNERRSAIFNLTSMQEPEARVVWKNREGQFGTNHSAAHWEAWTQIGWPRISVAIPAEATEIAVEFSQRVRRGRTRQGTGSTLFLLPWGRREIYQSGVIRVPNAPSTDAN